jgi:hypothetical protein
MGSILNLQKRFAEEVEVIVGKGKSSYIEAVIDVCEKHGIEPSSVAKFLPKSMKERLKVEGQDLNLIPKDRKQKRLPFK